MLWMMRFLGIGMDCLSGMILLFPLVLLFQKLAGRKIVSIHTVWLLFFACALTGICSVTGLPTMKDCRIDLTVNLIPMVDILNSPKQYLLNILMFVPTGFLLPLLWEKYEDWKHVLLFCSLLTIFIEGAQIFTFRTTDIDDLLMNLLGGGLGFSMVRYLTGRWKFSCAAEQSDRRMPLDGPWLIFLAVFLIHFFIWPYWSAFFWDTVLG